MGYDRYTKAETASWARRYQQGESLQSIGWDLHIAPATVKKYVLKHGVTVRPKGTPGPRHPTLKDGVPGKRDTPAGVVRGVIPRQALGHRRHGGKL